MNGIEIIIGGFIAGFFFMGCCFFIKGLIGLYRKLLNVENI
jgi:hypothetical protein